MFVTDRRACMQTESTTKNNSLLARRGDQQSSPETLLKTTAPSLRYAAWFVTIGFCNLDFLNLNGNSDMRARDKLR